MSDNKIRVVEKFPQGKSNLNQRTCILVLGMHRSGTSSLTRVMNIAGAALPANLMSSAKGNETGHWESNTLVAYNERLLEEFGTSWSDWRPFDYNQLGKQRRDEIKAEICNILDQEYGNASLIAVKDPRICRFADIFIGALDQAGFEVCILLPFRNPLEVCESLARRDGMPCAEAALLWLRHVLDSESATRSNRRVFLSYDALLSDWKESFGAVSKRIDIRDLYSIEEIKSQVDKFLAPNLRHHFRTTEEILVDPIFKVWIGEAYEALLVLGIDPDSKNAMATLDKVSAEFNGACPVIHRLYADAVSASEGEINDLNAALTNSKNAIAEHDQIRSRQDEEFIKLKASLKITRKALKKRNKKLLRSMEKYDERVDELQAALAGKTADISDLNVKLTETETAYNAIESNFLELENHLAIITGTLSWKVTRPLRYLRGKQLEISKRIGNSTYAVKQSGGLATASRKLANVLMSEGIGGLKTRLREIDQRRQNPEAVPFVPAGTVPVLEQVSESDPDISAADIERNILENLKSLQVLLPDWSDPAPKKVQTAKEVVRKIDRMSSSGFHRLILSVSHDNYTEVIGGLQLCVGLEEREFSKRGDLYLNIHPFCPSPILSPITSLGDFFFRLIANGQAAGVVSATELTDVLRSLNAKIENTDLVIHALLGHSPEILKKVFQSAGVSGGLFWLHDQFSICPSFNLLRNTIKFCNAPLVHSPACNTCIFGEDRASHLERFRSFFEGFEFDIVSPSQFQLDHWKKSSELPHHDARVIPHCDLTPRGTVETVEQRQADGGPIRVAFLGHPAVHKGWLVFAQLVTKLSKDPRYEFHHLGQTDTGNKMIRFSSVEASATDRDAMAQAIVAKKIDAAFLWSICPETFSFTLHEALAVGASVITNPNSGNIHAVAKDHERGLIFNDEARLMEYFTSGQLEDHVSVHRGKERMVYDMKFSQLSAFKKD